MSRSNPQTLYATPADFGGFASAEAQASYESFFGKSANRVIVPTIPVVRETNDEHYERVWKNRNLDAIWSDEELDANLREYTEKREAKRAARLAAIRKEEEDFVDANDYEVCISAPVEEEEVVQIDPVHADFEPQFLVRLHTVVDEISVIEAIRDQPPEEVAILVSALEQIAPDRGELYDKEHYERGDHVQLWSRARAHKYIQKYWARVLLFPFLRKAIMKSIEQHVKSKQPFNMSQLVSVQCDKFDLPREVVSTKCVDYRNYNDLIDPMEISVHADYPVENDDGYFLAGSRIGPAPNYDVIQLPPSPNAFKLMGPEVSLLGTRVISALDNLDLEWCSDLKDWIPGMRKNLVKIFCEERGLVLYGFMWDASTLICPMHLFLEKKYTKFFAVQRDGMWYRDFTANDDTVRHLPSEGDSCVDIAFVTLEPVPVRKFSNFTASNQDVATRTSTRGTLYTRKLNRVSTHSQLTINNYLAIDNSMRFALPRGYTFGSPIKKGECGNTVGFESNSGVERVCGYMTLTSAKDSKGYFFTKELMEADLARAEYGIPQWKTTLGDLVSEAVQVATEINTPITYLRGAELIGNMMQPNFVEPTITNTSELSTYVVMPDWTHVINIACIFFGALAASLLVWLRQ